MTDEVEDDRIDSRWEQADFNNEQAIQRHEKHLAEYGISWPEYVQGARDLLNHSITDDVDGFTNDSGGVYRYDIERNDFVIGAVIDGKEVIITRFKPRDGLNYWKGVKESEHADT